MSEVDFYVLAVRSDAPQTYRWVILQEADDPLHFKEHSFAQCDFGSYADALNAGTVAMAKLDGEPYENEAADPVSEGDCA